MALEPSGAQAIARLPTGVSGLDIITQGGLFRGGIYIVMGVPGAGKTILANQICFSHAATGGRAVYVTLLSESHGRLLTLMRSLSFFDVNQVASSLYYISGYTDLQAKGLRGLLDLIRSTVRAQRASLVVIDGLATVSDLAVSDLDFKRFIQELQVYLEPLGCTALLLAQPGGHHHPPPEHTMVDGIIQLTYQRVGLRAVRELEVLKLRGSNFIDGGHAFRISDAGIHIYPRTEARYSIEPRPTLDDQTRLQFGIPGLDTMLRGGVGRGSTTMLLGASGSGKTVLALNFLSAGAQIGEPGMLLGFYEPGPRLILKARSVGLDLAGPIERGLLEIRWQSAVEEYLDSFAEQTIELAQRRKVRRLVIDGFDALRSTAIYPERIKPFLNALTNELQARGVTTLLTVELQDLLSEQVTLPFTGVSEIVDNILLLRHIEVRSQIHRTLSVIKMRDSEYDPVIRVMTISGDGVEVAAPFAAIMRGNGDLNLDGSPDPAQAVRRRRRTQG